MFEPRIRKHSKRSFRMLGVVMATALFIVHAGAQVSGTGSIQGTVTDPSGAIVSGATVTATNPATGQSVTATTTSAGFYVLSALPSGEYNLEFKQQGFAGAVQQHVKVDPISIVGLNITLKIGSTSEEVVVTAAPPALNTETGTLQTVLPTSTYTALPITLNAGPKSPLGLAALLPGTSSGFNGYNINGGPEGTSVLYLNGMAIFGPELQGDSRNINVSTTTEVVQEFQILTSGIPAYYTGHGIINLVSKSGTNSIHGDVYENVRNTAFDSPGALSAGVVPIEHQNEYGASVGGPLRRNRIFYFGNIDRYKEAVGNTPSYYTLPTMAERMGDFSALPVPIYDPSSTVCSGTGACTRTAFTGNQIPAARFSNAAKVLMAALPATTNNNLQANYLNAYTNTVIDQNTYMGKVDAALSDKHHAYMLVEKGRQTKGGMINQGFGQLPLPYASYHNVGYITWDAQIGETWSITPNLINVFGVQYNRESFPVTNPTLGTAWASQAGLSGLPLGVPQNSFIPVAFGGPNAPTAWNGSSANRGYTDTMNMYSYQDSIQWTKGKHYLTVGGSLNFQQHNYTLDNFVNFTFSNAETAGFTATGGIDATTGNSFASYLLGAVDGASAVDQAAPETAGRYSSHAIYVQDNWKVTPRLAINLGLRYDIDLPYHEAHNHLSWFNPDLANPAVGGFKGALQFAGNGTAGCNCSTRVQTHYLAFDPRLGLAFSLNSKTVLRASFGINHFLGGALGGSDVVQGTGILGFSANPTPYSPNSGITPAFYWDNGFPAYTHAPFFDPTLSTGYNTTTGATGGTLIYDNPAVAALPPYTEDWNLTISRALAPSVIFELSYAANQSHHLNINENLNYIQPKYLALGALLQSTATPTSIAAAQAIIPGIAKPYPAFVGSIGQMLLPYPQYAQITNVYAPYGSANYNSLQASIQKRMSNGLYLLASYVWSKSIDNGGATVGFQGSTPRSIYNLKAERAVSTLDIPNAFKAAWVYALPFGKGQRYASQGTALNAIFGNWQLSGDVNYSDGTPLTITGSCTTPYAGGCYPNYNPNFRGPARINGKWGVGNATQTAYINVSAFQNAAPYTVGNLPRTLAYGLRNPWSLDEDMSIGKNFELVKSLKLRLQADAFNVFNRTVFGGISGNITSTNFGHVTSQANNPRQMQFEVYLKF